MPATAEARYSTAELTRRDQRTLTSSAYAQSLDELSQQQRSFLPVSEPAIRSRVLSSRGVRVSFTYEDRGQPLPSWLDATLQRIADVLTLPANWDSYGGKAIAQSVVDRTLEVLDSLMSPTTRSPSVVPLSEGGLQLEWHLNPHHFEVILSPEEGARYYHYDSRTGAEESEKVEGREAYLRELLSRI